MATHNPNLPEGTDSIIAGASVTHDDAPFAAFGDDAADAAAGGTGSLGGGGSAAGGSLRDQATARVGDLRGQATDKAREMAEQGKDRATEALDNVAKLIGDAAAQVDDKVGAQYGDYARRASDTVAGLAATLRDKDVDALFADARELVRRSPAIAIGAAAVVGFALVRVVKSGGNPSGTIGGASAGGSAPSTPKAPDVSPAA